MARLTKADAARQLGISRTTLAGTPVVYIIAEHKHAPLCKIGVTTNLMRRLSTLQTASPLQLQVICTWDIPLRAEALRFEGFLLHCFRSYRVRGEWFSISPYRLLQTFYADVASEQVHLHRRWLQVSAREGRVRAVLWHSMLDKQEYERAERVYTRIRELLVRISDTWWARNMQMLCSCTMHV